MELHDLLALTQTATGLIGVLAILWGLAQIQQSGRRRDKEIDALAETLRESTRLLSQGIERQGQALERQGQALAELLRHSA